MWPFNRELQNVKQGQSLLPNSKNTISKHKASEQSTINKASNRIYDTFHRIWALIIEEHDCSHSAGISNLGFWGQHGMSTIILFRVAQLCSFSASFCEFSPFSHSCPVCITLNKNSWVLLINYVKNMSSKAQNSYLKSYTYPFINMVAKYQ